MNYRIVKETLTYHDGTKEITYYIQRDDEGGWHRISPKFKTEEACRMALNEYILPDIEIEVIENFENV
jgi:nuclear transport factor 2 (NTF2) superfamily protein